MSNETLFALIFANTDGGNFVVFWENVVAICVAAALGTVWLGGAGEAASNDETERKERTARAFRTFSEIVSAFVAERDAAKRRETGRDDAANDDSPVADANADERGALNAVDFWREDYWNFDFGLDRDEFESDDADDKFGEKGEQGDADKNAGRAETPDPGPVRNDRDAREGLDPTPEETENRRRSGNYFGAFFQKRAQTDSPDAGADAENAPPNDSQDASSGGETPRWKRSKNVDSPPSKPRRAFPFAPDADADDPDAKSGRSDAANDRSNGDAFSTPSESILSPNDDSASGRADLGGDRDDSADDANDDDSSEFDFDYWNDDASWDDGPNEKYLDDDAVSDDEKIAYLRERIANGDDASREELARLLVQIAAGSGRDELDKALAALDEAEEIASDAAEDGDEERVEFLGQILLQRPLFYLRNGLEPPMKTANDALSRIRAWAEDASNPDARRLLATAWQTRGNCLAAIGCEAAAVESLKKAVELFETSVDEGSTEAEPSLGYASASLGETYLAIGDRPRSIESFRKAIETFEKYAAQEPFLAEQVNVLFRLSVALRQAGDDDGAEVVLQRAVDAEERLLSFDEEDYVGPLSQLLNVQADFYLRRNAFEDALVALDQAISALKRYLACDVALSNRVRSYLILEASLRKRAAVCLWLERRPAAIRDVEEALDYLALAAKKGENFEPIGQLIAFCGLFFDCAVATDDWTFVARSQEEIERLVARLTPEETRRFAPLYGQLLLQRHVALARANRFDDAIASTEKAIAVLEAQADDGELERRVLLAKALFQRAVFRCEIEERNDDALADFLRAEKIYDEARADDELDETSAALYLELLRRKAFIETKARDFDAARDDLRRGIREALARLRRKKWRDVDELENLSRTTVLWTRAARDDVQALRVVRLWTRYWRRLRRFYVDSSRPVEQTDDRTEGANADAESNEIYITLEKIEGAIADLRRFRVEILETVDWQDDFAKYCDVEPEIGVEKERGAAPGRLSSREIDAETASSPAATPTPTSKSPSFSTPIRTVAATVAAVWRRLSPSKNAASAAESNVAATLDAPARSVSVSVDVSLRNVDLEAARRAFATENLADDPKTRAIFDDLTCCLRVVGRRIEQGNFALTEMFYRLLDKLTDVCLERDALFLATLETLDATRRFETADAWRRAQGFAVGLPTVRARSDADARADAAPIFPGPFEPNDAPFFASIFPFWEFQTVFLARLTTPSAPGDAASAPKEGNDFNVALALETFRTTVEIARRSANAIAPNAEKDASDAPSETSRLPETTQLPDASDASSNDDRLRATTAELRAFSTIDVYFVWLAKRGRAEEGLALVRAEEARLRRTFAANDPFARLAFGSFYFNFGGAARDAELFDEARRAYLQAETLYKEETRRENDPAVWERLGDVQRELGRLATRQGNDREIWRRFRFSFDYYWRFLQTGTFDADVFQRFVQIALFFFEENPRGAGNVAFDRLRPLEDAARNWNPAICEATAGAFWRLKTAAAFFGSRREFSARRRSLYATKRLYREANELLARPELADVPSSLVARAKYQEGEFWLRAGFATQGRAALDESIRRTLQDASDAQDAERSVFIDRLCVATAFVQEGDFEAADRIFTELSATARRVEPPTLKTLARGRRADRDEFETAKNWAALFLVLERGLAEFETERGDADAACRRCRRAAKTARKLFAKGSTLELTNDVYWAQAALKGKNNRLAIALTERFVRATERENGGDAGSTPLLCSALRIQASALLERARRGDLARAERAIAKALELAREEFAKKFFELRGVFAEILLVKARLEAKKSNVDAALAAARRARQIVETLVRRGQTYRERFLRQEIAPFLTQTEALVAAMNAGPFDSRVKIERRTPTQRTCRPNEAPKKIEKETNDEPR